MPCSHRNPPRLGLMPTSEPPLPLAPTGRGSHGKRLPREAAHAASHGGTVANAAAFEARPPPAGHPRRLLRGGDTPPSRPPRPPLLKPPCWRGSGVTPRPAAEGTSRALFSPRFVEQKAFCPHLTLSAVIFRPTPALVDVAGIIRKSAAVLLPPKRRRRRKSLGCPSEGTSALGSASSAPSER